MTVQKPTTLSDMRRLKTEHFRQIDAYQYRGSVSKKKVIRHLIRLAADELSWQGREDAGSLRDFWYNPTKPILEEALPNWGDGAGSSDWNREMSKRLSGVLSDLVKDPEESLTYRDLNILDDSRDRRIATDSLEADTILFVEKSAAYRKLKPLADIYDLTLVEGSGWSATALIEDLRHKLPDDETFTFFVLGDYDPTGFGIVDDFIDRADKLGINVDRQASRRIGVMPDQVPDDTVAQQKFTVGGSNNDEWKRNHGIDGEYGLEIEAVGEELEGKAQALRELVVDEIGDDIDEQGRRFEDTLSSAANVPGGAARQVVSDLTDDLEVALTEAACEVYAEQDGVTKAEHSRGTRATVGLSREDTLEGETGELVPDPYPEGRLHSAAVSGSRPSVRGARTAQRKLKSELKGQIDAGEIDVANLLNVDN